MNSEKPWKFQPAMIGHITSAFFSIVISIGVINDVIFGEFGSNIGYERLIETLLKIFLALAGFAMFYYGIEGVLRRNVIKSTHLIAPFLINLFAVLVGGSFIFLGNPPTASRLLFTFGIVGLASLLIFWKDYAKGENL